MCHQYCLGENDASSQCNFCRRTIRSVRVDSLWASPSSKHDGEASKSPGVYISIEGKVTEVKEFTSHAKPGMSIASVALIEATRFWVRGDALNSAGNQIDLSVLRPVAQLGGISYGRVTETFELPRRSWDDVLKEAPWLAELPGAKIEGT